MRKLLSLIVLLGFGNIALAQTDNNAFNLRRIWASPDFYAKGIYGIQMLPDGKTYAQSDYALRGSNSVILKYKFDKDTPTDTLFSSNSAKGLPTGFNLEDYSVSAFGNYILLQTNSVSIYRHSKAAQYYLYDTKTRTARLINNGKKVFYATISPDSRKVAYVYENNLYVEYIDPAMAPKSGNPVQITSDGAVNKIINGKTDWVYEEEFALVRGFEWSPLSDKLAYYHFDESKVREYELTYYDSLYPSQYHYKYPTAGEANSEVSIYVYSFDNGKSQKIEVGEKNDQYIPRIKWTNDDNTLAIERLNRTQNHLEILFANALSGKLTTAYDETAKTYIEINDNLIFLRDNSFLITSDKGGYNQIYWIAAPGQVNPGNAAKIRLITQEQSDVAEIYGFDEKKGIVYYSAYEPTPMARTVYQIGIDGSGRKPLINNQSGRNAISFSSDRSYFILTSSSAGTPTQVNIYKSNGKLVRNLEDNQELKQTLSNIQLPQKEFFKIPINDTLYLNAWMIRPADFSSGKKYPVLFTVYGGPGSQTVIDQWGNNNDIWYAYLATKGIIVVSVDPRGTGARGAGFRQVTYKKLGIIESDDITASARWMSHQPYVDANRIGIWGWSFGGYMSLMNLMRGNDVFKMAVSVAPVTDWHYYDNIYTERYMQRPQDNAGGYDETSVFKYVPQMRGELLLIHGTFDDNVHPQNSIMLISELIKQGKTYDSEFYPNKNHSIYGGNTRYHLFSRMTDYILNHL